MKLFLKWIQFSVPTPQAHHRISPCFKYHHREIVCGLLVTVSLSLSLRMPCFTCIESSFDRMLWVHSNCFQMQMPHLESTPDLLPA
ncbi:hypothetical protein FKM82_023784 [Ascaphus truei]